MADIPPSWGGGVDKRPCTTYEAAESREVEVVADVLIVHLAEELVALEAHEPRDPRHLLVVLLAARHLAAATAAAVAAALAVAAQKQTPPKQA